MRRATGFLFVLAGTLLALNCEVAKTSNPLSPVVAGPMAGIGVSYPGMLSPGSGAKIKDREQPLTLVVGNPDTNSPRTMFLQVQIATDAAFKSVVFSRDGVPLGGDGQTRIPLGDKLQGGRTYYWRTNATDGANESGWSEPHSFDVLQPIVLGVPTPASPINNIVTLSEGPTLTATNAASSGPTGTINYHFQVSESQTFSALAVNGLSPQGNGSTTYATLLQYGKSYFWRVRMLAGDNTAGAWSSVATFRTPDKAAAPTPSPSPGPTPSPGNCAKMTAPLDIIQCYRDLYPTHMAPDQAVSFMKSVAHQFNVAGVSSGGAGSFGALRKLSGNNCNGYSCDVLCAGQGSSQKQWDILVDEKWATWGDPIPGAIRIDVCDIQ